MKKGFTLIELIFVIVIIGMLSAAAIPKFKNLKENAELNNLAKIISDATSSVPAAFINEVDLNGVAEATIKLNEIFQVKGKGWVFEDSDNGYKYKSSGTAVAYISLHPGRELRTGIYCNNFATDTLKQKCKDKFPINSDEIWTEAIRF